MIVQKINSVRHVFVPTLEEGGLRRAKIDWMIWAKLAFVRSALFRGIFAKLEFV